MNYKSGDLVKITGNCSWHGFVIGETVRLQYKCRNNDWRAESLSGISSWYVMEFDMAPVKPATMPQKIVITTDGKTALARLFDGKTMVKRAEAKCAPSDTFDFSVGAELAVKRLMGAKPVTEPIKESEPVKLYCVKSYEPGEWLTKGKIYELDADGKIRFDDGYSTDFNSIGENALMKSGLVPLVHRPAKVGEWVLVDRESEPKQVRRKCCAWDGCIVLADGRHSKGRSGFAYLVLDGYHGYSE